VKSPEFAPIELCFHKLKHGVRTQYHETEQKLRLAIFDSAKQISKGDIMGFFKHSFSFVKA